MSQPEPKSRRVQIDVEGKCKQKKLIFLFQYT